MELKKQRRLRQQQQQKFLKQLAQLQQNANAWLADFMSDGLSLPTLPKLKLATEEKVLTYGRYALANILQRRQKLANMLQACQISSAYYQQQMQLLQQKSQAVLCTRPLQAAFASDYSITFYPATIEKVALQNHWDYQQHIAAIMIHEMFHAYHYMQITQLKQSLWNVDASLILQVNTVKEALACFAQYTWLKEHALDEPRIALYNDVCAAYHYYPSYPYAGLRAIIENEHPKELFMSVYQQSLKDWQSTYKLLTKA